MMWLWFDKNLRCAGRRFATRLWMIGFSRHIVLRRYLRRVVSTLAVVSIVSATMFGGILHGSHEFGQSLVSSEQFMAETDARLELSHAHHTPAVPSSKIAVGFHLNHDHAKAGVADPASAPSHRSDVNDCACCCTLHCFACVIPTTASVLVSWLKSKREVAAGLFAEPQPSWRLERPPKISI